MRTRAIVFDLDDTLYPRGRFVRSGFAAVATFVEQQFGIPASQALTTLLKAGPSQPGAEFQTLCEAIGLPDDALPKLVHVFRTHTPALWLFHDVEVTLRELRANGWRLAILTNGLPDVQAAKIDALGLGSLVDHVVFAAEHAEGGKPHADAFHAVLARLDLPADRCVMVGDDVECDVRGARAAGMYAIRIRRDDGNPWSDAHATVALLGEVPAVADSLLQRMNAHAA
jgi:putative hydrolase of the HAD superfamily